MRLLLTIAAFLAAVFSAAGAEADTGQRIFDPNFRSLQVRVNGDQLAAPVIAIDSGDRIEIVFDEIADDRTYMRWELIHCNSRWEPDGLVDSEFLDGFNIGDVDDYEFSRATLVHYVNYRITIPDERVRITASGNYVVRVYLEDDPDHTVLQARFCVTENRVGVSGGVTSRTDVETNGTRQQVEFTVDTREAPVEDIFNDLTVVVSRNGDPAGDVIVTHPLRVQGTKAVYEHLRQLIFEGGNEFRRFETVTTRYPGIGIAEIGYHDPLYHFSLMPDQPRSSSRYVYDSTQHGRFFIREAESANGDTGADYVAVHFTLEMSRLKDADVYVDGDLTGHRRDETTRMTYNPEAGAYELTLMLKQGAYNYQYVTVPFGSDVASPAAIEGNFHETVNEYLIKVYHRPRGARYEHLLGAATIVSAP